MKNTILKYIYLVLIAFLFAGTGTSAFAQFRVTGQDTVIVEVKKKEGVKHSPRKATLYSTVLPGLGQIYNKKYWKLPLIYGGFVGFGYAINWNNKHYVKYKKAYDDITDDNPNTNSYLELPHSYYDLTSSSDVTEFAENIESARNSARRYRDMNIIFTIAFYALNIIDANVDANFFDFDISDDLSMVCTPQIFSGIEEPQVIGFNCCINF